MGACFGKQRKVSNPYSEEYIEYVSMNNTPSNPSPINYIESEYNPPNITYETRPQPQIVSIAKKSTYDSFLES